MRQNRLSSELVAGHARAVPVALLPGDDVVVEGGALVPWNQGQLLVFDIEGERNQAETPGGKEITAHIREQCS